MIKRILPLLLFSTIICGCCSEQQTKTTTQYSFTTMESNFRHIPDNQKLAVYWYWVSDNISVDGVIKDLHAMKEAGINRAFIGNIGVEQIPYGDIKVLSDEWWEVMHAALKTAGELDIEIGIFNSPGWSQSGGPWIKPEQSMRYLSSTQTYISGPSEFNQVLAEKSKEAQDVKVIAYPTLKQRSHFERVDSKNPSDNHIINLRSSKPAIVRSLTIKTVEDRVKTNAELFVNNNGKFESLCKIEIDRSNPNPNVGFDPYAPIVISIPDIKASEFRLEVEGDASIIEEINLSDIPYIERYPEKSLAKMFQTPLPMWDDYLWSVQPEVATPEVVVCEDQVIDITEYMDANGRLKWSVPEGNWTIMRTAMETTGVCNGPASPEATGLETDKMSKEHIAYHFDQFIGKILDRIPAEDRKTFRVVVEDSYETGGTNWTDTMIDDFIVAYGYNPIKFLPVLQGIVVGSRDQSDRFLWDLRRLIADKVAYDYVGGLREISNAHGLTTWLENYGHWGFPAEFLQYGGQSDEVAGEFWSVGSLGDIENRAASSCAHIYGKKRVWAESFTCGGPDYYRYPAEMKMRGDKFFTEGINSTLLHLYIQQPNENVPGINAPWGNEFNRHNTWFSHLDIFAKYLKRCNYMLQQGQYIADVAYFIGEDTPKMTGVCDPELPIGHSFDYINAEILLNAARVEDGKLKLDSGMEYKVLVLPKIHTMRPELLSKIESLIADGLVVLGAAPTQSPSLENYPESDKKVQDIASQLWSGDVTNGAQYKKGKVYSGVSLEKIFSDLDITPDFASSLNKDLLYIHRKTDEGDLYFISNQTNKKVETTACFKVSGKNPELWNPQTAIIRTLNDYKQADNGTEIPIALQPYESAFIVFRDTASKSSGEPNFPDAQIIAEITNPWIVKFQEDRSAPEQSVKFDELIDWRESNDDRIKYFSGSANYTTTFTLNEVPSDKPIYIDLGKVMVMAKIKINGEYVGGVWTAPYNLDVTDYVKQGDNRVEVEVVNTWLNRIIGDKNLPEDKRIVNQTFSYNKATTPLQSAGLLGPVVIQTYDYDIK